MTPDPQPALSPLEDLIEVLTLEELGTAKIAVTGIRGQDAASSIGATSARVFEGRSQRSMGNGRVFGGQVLAQCVMAAGLTMKHVEQASGPRPIHSLHGYFMRPGDDTLPIRFAVEEMRDGGSFSTRRVHAIQKDAPIMSFTCSFQERAGGLDHQLEQPDVPGPHGLKSLAQLLAQAGHPLEPMIAARPIEQRPVELQHELLQADQPTPEPGAPTTAANAPASENWRLSGEPGDAISGRSHLWMRTIGDLPDDPLVHAAVLAYASDYSLLEPVLRRHGMRLGDPTVRIASLDHSMWFHRPLQALDWVLYALHSPSATSGRGLGIGQMFQHGVLVATTAQEGMIRLARDK